VSTDGFRLGLDWDDTVTDYPAAFALLCRAFRSVVIITLNQGVTIPEAEHRLGCTIERIEHCPDEVVIAGRSHVWKAETCRRLGVDLMFDDDPDVVKACLKAGIQAIGVMPLPGGGTGGGRRAGRQP
jgi:hypothetical protein